MKTRIVKTTSIILLAFLFAATFALRAEAVPVNPFPAEVEQADGSVITIRGFGDEFFSWTEAEDGYVIAYDMESENWCYAYLSEGEILPGPEIVGGGLVEDFFEENIERAAEENEVAEGESDEPLQSETSQAPLILPPRITAADLQGLIESVDVT
ncbi:MAG: hypothetical protein LBI54_08265, partial [Lachnospiraceae bacterium]|nr:hypothetical protein [Lachnospiraceae bacterium]